MSKIRYTIWSIILFLLGFYTRGFVDLLFSFQRIGFTSNVDSLKKIDKKTFIKQYWQQKGDEIDLTSNSVTSNSKTRGNDHMGRTHWCIIASKFLPRTTRNHFDHFPHTSEIVLPCWSYFVEQGVTNRCGFAIASNNYKFPQWIKELIDAMGCEIRESDKGLPKDNIVDFVPADDVQFIPNYYLLRPRLDYIRYLNHPEHAHMLRRLYVDDEYIAQVKGDGKPIQIGIIQRQGARQINNLDEIHMTLKQDIPHGNITVTDFSFKTVKEQAIWFATKDVIIASHGAALTNSIFITPGTIVMQLYKPGYFLQTLEVSYTYDMTMDYKSLVVQCMSNSQCFINSFFFCFLYTAINRTIRRHSYTMVQKRN